MSLFINELPQRQCCLSPLLHFTQIHQHCGSTVVFSCSCWVGGIIKPIPVSCSTTQCRSRLLVLVQIHLTDTIKLSGHDTPAPCAALLACCTVATHRCTILWELGRTAAVLLLKLTWHLPSYFCPFWYLNTWKGSPWSAGRRVHSAIRASMLAITGSWPRLQDQQRDCNTRPHLLNNSPDTRMRCAGASWDHAHNTHHVNDCIKLSY